MKRIILASASPRRRELMGHIGVPFEILVSGAEETYSSTSPAEIVQELAQAKAENVAEKIRAEEGEKALCDTVLIGADTIVACGGKILGKPSDEEDACRMLRYIQGRMHQVYTGVAVLAFDADGQKQLKLHAEETKVFVHEMDEAEIRRYFAAGESMDKAGAYGIQGSFAAYIDRIEGDYFNVVGLPVSHVYRCLKEIFSASL